MFLRRRWGRNHGRIPVKKARTTIAGEQFAFTKLVPGLGPDAHAASRALLIFNAGKAGSPGGAEAVKAGEHLWFDVRTQSLALSEEGGLLVVDLGLTKMNTFADLVEGCGERFNLGAGCSQGAFLCFAALQAGKLFVFNAFSLGLGKANLVLDGLGLLRGFDGVELNAEANGLLAVCG